jgi:geranylgeranyl diphosphate synthase type II
MAATANAASASISSVSAGAEPLWLAAMRTQIEQKLAALCGAGTDVGVAAAQCYALLAPGKRVRPVLTLLAARQHGADLAAALEPACAVEMVHTASLILDDLPCMDDAQLRRGRPATHRVYGEAAALLAAVGLLNRAFGLLAHSPGLAPEVRIALAACLSAAVGQEGLVGGQEADLAERVRYRECADVDALNRRKTGALFAAAMEIGARAAGAGAAASARMAQAGAHVGLAFQTVDDLLDCTRRAEELGKDANQDVGKPSVVSLAGLEAARSAALRDLQDARAAARASGGDSAPFEAFLDATFTQALA